MIDFDIEKATATRQRLATLSETAQKQHSAVMATYSTVKSKMMNKLSAVKRDISSAHSDKTEAQHVLSHNKEVENRTHQQIRDLKDDIERLEDDKEKAEKDIDKAEKQLEFVQALQNAQNGNNSSASNAASQLQSQISKLESKITKIEKDISQKRREIEALERKLRAIERANRQLEQIIKSIESSIKQLEALSKQIEAAKSQMMRYHEIYDGKCGETRRGMEAICSRSDNAIKAGENALYQFQQAGCGYAKCITVDSPSTISKMAMDIKSAATDISFAVEDLGREAERFRNHLKDRVTADVKASTSKIKDNCKSQSGAWQDSASCLSNAASHLEWYLGFRM